MRKDFTLYPLDEALSVRKYVHDTGQASEFHEKGVKLLHSFLAGITKPGQELLSLFRDFKKAMSEPQHLGQQTNKSDVTSTLRNILREIYGSKRFNALDAKVTEVEDRIQSLEALINQIVGEDVSDAIANLGKSQRQLARENPKGVVSASRKPRTPKATAPIDPAADEAKYQAWSKSLPAEGTPEWDRWVAMRAHHIQQQKEKAHDRGDSSKGDNLHGNDWWDHKSHWLQAHDEISRYVKSGKDNKNFVWSKHFQDWRAHIGQAINEYYEAKANQDTDFLKSIMPPKPRSGYM